VEVSDEDTSSPQAMESAPLLGRSVCASCNEEIVDKYLLKVKKKKKDRGEKKNLLTIALSAPFF